MGIREILTSVWQQQADKEEFYLKVGTASEIDLNDNTFTFTPIDNTAPVQKALLKTIGTESGGSVVVIPVDGSFVAVGFLTPVTALCLYVEVAEKITWTAETLNLKSTNLNVEVENFNIEATETIFNSGNFGGLIKIEILTEKLNAMRTTLNNLITDFKTHTHGGVSSGTAFTSTTVKNPSNAAEFIKEDYENESIKH